MFNQNINKFYTYFDENLSFKKFFKNFEKLLLSENFELCDDKNNFLNFLLQKSFSQ